MSLKRRDIIDPPQKPSRSPTAYHLQECVNSAINQRIQDAVDVLNAGSAEITEWDENVIRQLVDTVKVLSADRIRGYHGPKRGYRHAKRKTLVRR